MGNKNLVITIEREYGSGGRIVGRRLADEKAGNNLLHRIVGRKLDFTEDPVLSGNVTAPENLFRFQSSVIRELAREESCIIVGRAAGYVLDQEEDLERLIRIFVCADKVRRVQRVMEVDAIDEDRAKRRIKKIEKSRREYYRYFTGSDWHNMKNYDLTINTTNFDLDQTAELVKTYIRLKGFDKEA